VNDSVNVEVAVVGGGPAGAITAELLARLGREVLVLERAPKWRWRACGVFASPASVAALRRLGVTDEELVRYARPISAMQVESARGTAFQLRYGTGATSARAVGFDRGALDPALLARARAAGATVLEGVTVEQVDLGAQGARLRLSAGEVRDVVARVVVGADGLRSIVARAASVSRPSAIGPRAALTFHIEDQSGSDIARMAVIDDGYVGLAPVPGGRVNMGIVLGPSWFAALQNEGAGPVARRALERVIPQSWGEGQPLDRVAGVRPLGHAVARRAGDGWLLVGDAAGFLDPFTGEGLHRAIVSAELAAETLAAVLAGRTGARLSEYDRAMRGRFATKDLVTRIVQGFLARPALFEYAARRLAARERVRETMGLVIGDLVPARRALDPRYLAALLAP
jgi:flavin-dependent dehydrogenase